MPNAVDLKGILFRVYSPQFDQDKPQFDQDQADGEYNPVGPSTADTTPGGVDLSCVMIRAWEENNLDLRE